MSSMALVGLGALGAHLAHPHQCILQLLQPLTLVLTDEAHAPRQGVAAAAGDAAADERVERVALGHAQARHDRKGERGEQLAVVTDLGAPTDLAAIAVLGLLGDADALLSGVLAEALDPGRQRRGLGGRGVVGEAVRGKTADDEDLFSVERDLRRPGEPLVREAAREPAAYLLGIGFGSGSGSVLMLGGASHGLHDYTLTALRYWEPQTGRGRAAARRGARRRVRRARRAGWDRSRGGRGADGRGGRARGGRRGRRRWPPVGVPDQRLVV